MLQLRPLLCDTLQRKLTYKGKSHLRTGNEGAEGEYRCKSTLSLASALEGVGGQGHAPAALRPLGWIGPRTGLDGCGK